MPKKIIILSVTVIALVSLAGLVRYATSDSVCTSCHSMSFAAEEYKRSGHYVSPTGMKTGCIDCHVGSGIKRIAVAGFLAQDLWAEFRRPIRDKNEWEKRRRDLAMKVRNDSGTDGRCSGCHNLSIMKPLHERGRIAHTRSKSEGIGCIECHRNLVHGEVD